MAVFHDYKRLFPYIKNDISLSFYQIISNLIYIISNKKSMTRKTTILALAISVATFGLLSSTVSFSNSADAQRENIPEWIQSVALFWG